MGSSTNCRSFVWMLVLIWNFLNVACTKYPGPLCGSDREKELGSSGKATTITLSLTPGPTRDACKLTLTAPSTHVISIRLVAPPESVKKAGGSGKSNRNKHGPHQKGTNGTHRGCPFSVYLPEDRSTPNWRFDPCAATPETLVGSARLLPPRISLAWSPPEGALNLQLLVTAVGQGEACLGTDQHVCLKIGYNPLLCVSNELVCDGIRHCPIGDGDSDEDSRMCEEIRDKKVQALWDLVEEGVLHETAEPNKNNDANPSGGQDTPTSEVAGMPPLPEEPDQRFSGLSQYGPWGFLLFGILICGGVLVVCGLWECFCRRPKSEPDSETGPPVSVIVADSPATAPPVPPRYDDLDQPPSYSVLFPRTKAEEPPSAPIMPDEPMTEQVAE